jgi:hypothetical protein
MQLVEQPRVLDGDDGLVCKSVHQLDLLRRERPTGPTYALTLPGQMIWVSLGA